MANNTVAGLADKKQERVHIGYTPFDHTVEFAAADLVNGDTFLIYKFPDENAKLWTALVDAYFDELDSNAIPTGTVSIGIGDNDGTIDTALLTDYDVGSAAAWSGLDAGVAPVIDVSGKYLIVDITAAMATAAAGNINFVGAFSAGLNSKSKAAK